MFDVTPDEIARLNDVDLRELVARLCEAELASKGFSPAAVTWGGHQTAADGGLDVRVALPITSAIDGFIPRAATGFQVKTPDMRRANILSEMRPSGVIRPVIQELADQAGAYIIVSSKGSVADTALRNRRDALRDGLAGVPGADDLHTDFYDRTRLATWTRRHPGLVAWVKEKVGRAFVGWRPYGPWSGGAETIETEYLLDDKLRLHLGRQRQASAQPVAQAIDDLRDELAQPGKMVRLVGLSGVGKTRLVQALFDARIGERPLPPWLAVYTNLSDNPDPQPTGLVSDLLANRARAILIVDNCPPDLHHRLSELCTGSASTVSVITVEYDVRDDQPEGTQVVTLDTSSLDLIEKLLTRRFPHLSEVDARTIATASDGNARIAIAIASTVGRSETVAGLSDNELFRRLFHQRQGHSDALLFAAQACSLVYSFQGETLTGEEAEIPHLAALIGQTPMEVYRHVGELHRRDLVQHRGVWRAVLPHAIANRLAAQALDDIPYDLIDSQLVTGGSWRLARSFSRRLSYLHEHPRAIAIVKRWLAPDGFLGDAAALNEISRAMFANIAPVLPEAALAALERACFDDPETLVAGWRWYLPLLRSLAYDPLLFDRSVGLLAQAATQSVDEREAKDAADTFLSLFTIYLSGTHAPIEQRLSVIESLFQSRDARSRALGRSALDQMLRTSHFSSHYLFEFGARSRDYGFYPRNDDDIVRWYGSALTMIERLSSLNDNIKDDLLSSLAQNFRGLWTSTPLHTELESVFRRFAAEDFWREGWAACRETLFFDKEDLPSEIASRLITLEADLRPSSLPDRVRAIVLGDRSGGLDLEDMELDDDIKNATARLEAIACELGNAVATDDNALTELLPDLLRGGNRAWDFGRGLAQAAADRTATWMKLVAGLEPLSSEERNIQALRGFIFELQKRDPELSENFLDEALNQLTLVPFLPVLQSAAQLDSRGIDRLKQGLRAGQVPVWMYRHLAFGRTTDHASGQDLHDLLLLIADQPDGYDVALEVLYMRLHSDRSAQRQHLPEILAVGRELLRRIRFRKNKSRDDYNLAGIVRACLSGDEAGQIAGEVARRLKNAVATYDTYAFDNHNLLKSLLRLQPIAVLNVLEGEDERDQRIILEIFGHRSSHRPNPADAISCEALIEWCEGNRDKRYALAASFVTFSKNVEGGLRTWSEQAAALLASASDPRAVLEVFIQRFRPMSWSGSRAALMEENACLLDTAQDHITVDLTTFLSTKKSILMRAAQEMRRRETEEDRARDETFE